MTLQPKKKLLLVVLFLISAVFSLHAQLAVLKMVGKNSGQNKLGYGVFANYDIPLNDIGNQSLMIELLDFGFFPGKPLNSYDDKIARGYISIKAGYRKIFSAESKTGFFIEPQLGYARAVVADSRQPEALYGDGIGAAFETGYSLEVGERGNAVILGLKYEADLPGSDYAIQAIGFRVSYSFSFLRKRRNSF